MPGKFIIDNRTDLPNDEAIRMVARVVADGRISNNGKQYSYGTGFKNKITGKRHMVWSDVNKRSDRFVIVEDKHYYEK